MNAADLARLEVARRAYDAAQPSAAEVQTGVRRARLALRRAKPRRTWIIKGLVFVVLALGSLAYAKPHALAELIEDTLPGGGAAARKPGPRLEAALTPPLQPARNERATAKPAVGAKPELIASRPVDEKPELAAAPTSDVARQRASASAPVKASRAPSRAQPLSAAKAPELAPVRPSSESPTEVSNWGRVGQALARGDEAEALSALGELSANDDPRTRDKADLGRAQLFMAHGNHDEACALARALSNRRAGSRIERQAQVLLKSCAR
jgi:hypothetical protein